MAQGTVSRDNAEMSLALAGTGLSHAAMVRANLSAAELAALAVARGEARLSEHGALIVTTGAHTGRSVADKFVADDPMVRDEIAWGAINQRLDTAHFRTLRGRILAYLQGQELFVQDCHAGADPGQRIKVRVVTTGAWQALFARNMFIRPTEAELAGFVPDYVILHAPEFTAEPAMDGVRGGTAIALSFEARTILIAGTQYAGEIKKSIFTVMNWILPADGVLPMHCSANVGAAGDVALFFGLSGTGKTTLSSDPARRLIGDDEHGWGEDGVFNIEGGCYAKVIDLSAEAEPQIWAASHRFGAVLENVVADAAGRLDLSCRTLTENTRSCYPIEAIANAERSGRAGQPRHVVMLTADAFGVLPPLSRLDPAQAMYHFLSGYTARVAGTESGLGREPQATFSACYGAPFLPRPPEVYGELLQALLRRHQVQCWLVNTGWTGGAYGTGQRMSITHTRALLSAALSGALDLVRFVREPYFGLMLPEHVPGVPDAVLNPSLAWADDAAYAAAARELAGRFERNFAHFAPKVDEAVRSAAIRPRRDGLTPRAVAPM